jgi:hypothetical protein
MRALRDNYRPINMKTFLPLVSFLLLATIAFARPVAYWPYDKLTKEADLIVIATPVSMHDTTEKTTLPGIQRVSADNVGRPVSAIGVETTFEILSVLKGDNGSKKFVFHHLREAEKWDRPEINGPGLVAFDPKEKKRFLIFLKRESDGRYSSLTGQTDPIGGIKDLGTYP